MKTPRILMIDETPPAQNATEATSETKKEGLLNKTFQLILNNPGNVCLLVLVTAALSYTAGIILDFPGPMGPINALKDKIVGNFVAIFLLLIVPTVWISFREGATWKDARTFLYIGLAIMAIYAIVNKVFPGYDPYEHIREKLTNSSEQTTLKAVTIFEKVYSDKDINQERGNIIALTWDNNFQIGDTVNISGLVPKSGKEIALHRGKKYNPEWITTKNGSLQYVIRKKPIPGTYLLAWIEKGKNISFKLTVTRT